MSEAKLQKKAQNELRAAGWYVVKVIAASLAGVPDLLCCSPYGDFVGFEIKYGKNKASKLQEYNLQQITKRKGGAYVISTIEELRQIINSQRYKT